MTSRAPSFRGSRAASPHAAVPTPAGSATGPRHAAGPASSRPGLLALLTGTSARRAARLAAGAAVVGGVVAGLLTPGVAGGPSTALLARPGVPPASRTLPPTELDPAAFAPGGCVALEPTTPARRNETVLVDAGHGGPDPGTSGVLPDGRAVAEKDVTLAVARETATQLRARGYRVVLSRTTDTLAVRRQPGDVVGGALTLAGSRHELGSRARCANIAGAAALLSVHANAFDDPAVRGTETLFDPTRPFGDRNERLASLVHHSMLRAYQQAGRPTEDRGVVGGTGTGSHGARTENSDLIVLAPADGVNVTEPSAMPGALVEPFFVTNPADAAAAVTPEGTALLGGALTAAVDQFLQEKA